MVNFGDVGRVCLNLEMEGDCQNCLWWEWDSGKRQCNNCQGPICPKYRQELFHAGSPSHFTSTA